jgi:predicted dehydrogenase
MSETASISNIAYQPRDPKSYKPNIAVIGTGGISASHLTAYKKANYNVVALCDISESAAKKRQAEFFPEARVYTDPNELFRRDDIEVVDITLHPEHRGPVIEAALNHRKHVLSQKPFVLDLDNGERLCELAEKNHVKLAVNQNGRWSPHWSYVRNAIEQGLIGNVLSAHLSVHWNHDWIHTLPAFDRIRHIMMYDYGIHYFDALSTFIADRVPTRVFASFTKTSAQKSSNPLLAQAIVEYDGAQATLVFDGNVAHGSQDRTYVGGTRGTILSVGPGLNEQRVTLSTPDGEWTPKLTGAWFYDGFHGTMAELLCAIEEKREPANSGRNNLRGLAICAAACASAEDGLPKRPGEVRKLPQ